jgi:hypothetical protein
VAGKRQLTPIEVFEANIGDAERLIAFARALTNGRKYGMRRELRESVGAALRVPKNKWGDLDCVESDDVFVVLMPGGAVRRAHFTQVELRPLLRQAVVAAAAAVESYVAEKAATYVATALAAPPERLKEVSMTLIDVMEIENRYKRRAWGYRAVLEAHLSQEASADPGQIGKVLSTVGQKGFWPKVDARRHVSKGMSETQLRALAQRRNKIAHTGDRTPTGRSQLALTDADTHVANARSIIEAMEAVLP